MNVNVDKQNLIPFPQAELRTGKRDGADNNYFAVKESFGEILEREFQIHSEKPTTHSEWKPLSADQNSYEVSKETTSNRDLESKPSSVSDVSQKTSESTSTQKSSEEGEEETTEEDDLDRDALEYSIGILSNQSLFGKHLLPANEANESLQKEKTMALSLQKSAEKHSMYASKESKSFLEETKQLAESFLKMNFADSKENLLNTKRNLADANSSNLVMFPNGQNKLAKEMEGKDSKSNSLIQKNENTTSGMTVLNSFLQKDKGFRGLENDNQTEQTTRKTDSKGKSSKNGKQDLSSTDSFLEKETTNVSITSDKMIRSLGFKEKEFQKQNENKNQFQNEKLKADPTFTNPVQTISSSQMGEENGKSTDDKGSRQGSNLHSVENKLHLKADGVKTLERTEKPKETNLKQNLDELIKQAKFDIVQNGKSSAEIIMNPKEYGRLTLKVTVDGEKVEGRILVDSEELQKSLQNEIQTIKENLKESGLDLQALVIDLWEDGSQFADRQNQNELYQTLIETAKNRGKMNLLETEEGIDLEKMAPLEDSKVLEFFA